MTKSSENTSTCRSPKSLRGHGIETNDTLNKVGGLVSITIDGKSVKVPLGTTILEASRKLNIRIPTLCYHDDLCIAGVCRICVVEVEKMFTLQAACAFPITAPITVHTHSRRVRQTRRHILDLMLSEHYGECYSCSRNGNCELQSLAEEYGVDFYRFGHPTQSRYPVDRSSHSVIRDLDKCILCRRCVRTCIDLQEVGVLEAVNRGDQVKISTFMEKNLADVICINCGQCINRCPTAALKANDPTDEVWAAIDDPEKHVIIQTAPSPRAAIAECFDFEPGTPMTWQLNTALRECGFDAVFDTNFSADLTIIEEGTELLLRLYKALVQNDQKVADSLPQFTSCSPGWVKYIEHFYPDYLHHLSSAKSPQQMFGSLIKTYYAQKRNLKPENIVSVALMPCSAKKFECNRPEMTDSGFKDVDYGLTTRELAKMIREAGIDLPKCEKSDFDDPFGTATGSGVIFGATGGVMESALRCVVELVTGEPVEKLFDEANINPVRGFEGSRIASITIDKVGPVPELLKHLVPNWDWLKGATLQVGVCHGTANAKKVMDDIIAGGVFSKCHFIEFMACPGGCLGGGGQPIPTSAAIRAARARAIYAEDIHSKVRKSHLNPAITAVYKEFLTDGPCGKKAHKLLHTHYIRRDKYIV